MSSWRRTCPSYLPVVSAIRLGHPLAVESADDDLPELDFGPLISASKATELAARVEDALLRGAVPLYRGRVADGRFLDGQDTSAYAAPVTLLAPPGGSRLMHEEPFGPVDTIIVVDTEAELLAQMNASNGALVASIACDDADHATHWPPRCRRSRSASTSRARVATGRRPSAGAGRLGAAASSGESCWYRR